MLFIVLSLAGAVLLIGNLIGGSSGATFLGLGLVVLGPLGGVVTFIELIRAVIRREAERSVVPGQVPPPAPTAERLSG